MNGLNTRRCNSAMLHSHLQTKFRMRPLGQPRDALEIPGNFPLAFTPLLSCLSSWGFGALRECKTLTGPISSIFLTCQSCPHHTKITTFLFLKIYTSCKLQRMVLERKQDKQKCCQALHGLYDFRCATQENLSQDYSSYP